MFGKLVMAFLTVGLVSAGMGYATFAFFSDTETATANIFTIGTLDLTVNDLDGVTGQLTNGNFAPGDTETATLVLKNIGTIGAVSGHEVVLDIKTDVTETDAQAGATDIASFLELTTLNYGTTDLLATLPDANLNGRQDLADLDSYIFTGLADPGLAGTDLVIAVLFVTSAGNALQGDEAQFDWTFFLRQAGETALA